MKQPQHRNRSVDRKGAQLCEQVRHALTYALPEVLADTRWDATVLEVKPAPTTSHLLVVLSPLEPLDFEGLGELHREIVLRSGLLRTAVAQAISRRKAPTLSFCIVPS